MNDIPRGIGDNQPPKPDPSERADALIATANRWIAERPEIENAEQAGLAQEFIAQLRQNKADLEAAEKQERQPLDLAVAAVRMRYRGPLESIGIAYTRMQQKLKPWLDREQDRLDAEAAERRRAAAEIAAQAEAARKEAEQSGTVESELAARDAAKAAAAASKVAFRPPAKARVKGDFATKAMTMKAYYFAEVTDESEALKTYGKAPSVRAAALNAATHLATALAKECKGDPSRCPKGFVFKRRETPV